MAKKLGRIPRLNPEVISSMVSLKEHAERSKLKGRCPCFWSPAVMVFTDPSPSSQGQPCTLGLPTINQGAVERISHTNHLERYFSNGGNNIIKPWQLNQNKWILKMTFNLGPHKLMEC